MPTHSFTEGLVAGTPSSSTSAGRTNKGAISSWYESKANPIAAMITIAHCTKGLSVWQKASNDQGVEPDVVMACAGDIPTKEALAAVTLLRGEFPDLKIVVGLWTADEDHH